MYTNVSSILFIFLYDEFCFFVNGKHCLQYSFYFIMIANEYTNTKTTIQYLYYILSVFFQFIYVLIIFINRIKHLPETFSSIMAFSIQVFHQFFCYQYISRLWNILFSQQVRCKILVRCYDDFIYSIQHEETFIFKCSHQSNIVFLIVIIGLTLEYDSIMNVRMLQ